MGGGAEILVAVMLLQCVRKTRRMAGVSRHLPFGASSSLVKSNTSRTLKRFKEGAGDLGAELLGQSAERWLKLISARIGCIASGEKMVTTECFQRSRLR